MTEEERVACHEKYIVNHYLKQFNDETIKSKQQKIVKAAQQYLIRKRLSDQCECRFDIVAIHGTIPNHNINWITHAFYAQT